MKSQEMIFEKILSGKSIYGIVWAGKYQDKSCAIKVVALSIGIHYNSLSREYYDDKKRIKNPTCFNKDESLPFLHTLYKERKAMTPKDFWNEVKELTHMAECGISPRVFGSFQESKKGINYGFIVMERTDCCLKDILIKRNITSDEERIIKKMINELHRKHELIHGDLKPSNIGVYLDSHGLIVKSCLFDCAKIKHRKDIKKEYDDLVIDDWKTYKRHMIKNKTDDRLV